MTDKPVAAPAEPQEPLDVDVTQIWKALHGPSLAVGARVIIRAAVGSAPLSLNISDENNRWNKLSLAEAARERALVSEEPDGQKMGNSVFHKPNVNNSKYRPCGTVLKLSLDTPKAKV